MDKFGVRVVLAELARIGSETMGDPGYGRPCSYLVRMAITYREHVEELVESICCPGASGEYRLNGAGLKLFYRRDFSASSPRMVVGGDQARHYPEFVAVANGYLKEKGLQER